MANNVLSHVIYLALSSPVWNISHLWRRLGCERVTWGVGWGRMGRRRGGVRCKMIFWDSTALNPALSIKAAARPPANQSTPVT